MTGQATGTLTNGTVPHQRGTVPYPVPRGKGHDVTAIYTVTILCDAPGCTASREHSGYGGTRPHARAQLRGDAQAAGWVTTGATRGTKDWCPTHAPALTGARA